MMHADSLRVKLSGCTIQPMNLHEQIQKHATHIDGARFSLDISAQWVASSLFAGRTLHGMRARDAVLDDSRFAGAHLLQADFTNASLQRCSFRWSGCVQALFVDADARFADFGGANLRGSEFGGACLLGAELEGADLRGATIDGIPCGVPGLRSDVLRRVQDGARARWYTSLADLVIDVYQRDGGRDFAAGSLIERHGPVVVAHFLLGGRGRPRMSPDATLASVVNHLQSGDYWLGLHD